MTPPPETGAGAGAGADIIPVILSGGSGTRLWPLSRARYPKQLQRLTSERSILQETALRLGHRAGFAAPMVVCNQDHRFIIAEQLRAIGVEPRQIVLEPVGRNTAPAATVAALLVAASAPPDSTLAILPADHVIDGEDAFRGAVVAGAAIARDGWIVAFGIRPTSAHSGYGYLNRGRALDENAGGYQVERFVGKPVPEVAARLLDEGDYLWNSGIFVFRASTLLGELERLRPEMVQACRSALAEGRDDLDFFRLGADAFESIASISIDYAVLERTTRAAVIEADFGWSDVGSWASLLDIGEKDGDGNLLIGDVLVRGVSNSYIRAESALIAAIGLEDVTVVETGDAILVAASDWLEEIKAVVERLKTEGREVQERHVQQFRPWRFFETLDAGPHYQVKHLMIKPGASLSLQKHEHRAEHWLVVAGTAKVTRGEEEMELAPNQSTYIPRGMVHRLENTGEDDLDIIEVQSGSYLGEDDITRLDDPYSRDPGETG